MLTPTELGNLLRQYGFPFDDGNLDFFQQDSIIRNSDIGRSIQPVGLSSLYALVGSGNAGAGGMALTPGQAKQSIQQELSTGVLQATAQPGSAAGCIDLNSSKAAVGVIETGAGVLAVAQGVPEVVSVAGSPSGFSP